MVTVTPYPVAVALCVVTILCWESWANAQKLATREWRFQLFYWDYSIGVFLLALLLALTLGCGEVLRSRSRASRREVARIIFNLSHILLGAPIDIAGMAMAFPAGVG
jgi:glucose uptake protein